MSLKWYKEKRYAIRFPLWERLLVHFLEHEGKDNQRLRKDFKVHYVTMSAHLFLMEEQELVLRVRSGRTSKAYLTSKGRAVAEKLAEVFAAVHEDETNVIGRLRA